MAQRRILGSFYSDALARQPELEFYFKTWKRCKVIRRANFEESFFDADLNCIFCPSFGVHCDFFFTSLVAKRRLLFGSFLEHLKETEMILDRFLVRPVGTQFPVSSN